MRNWKQGRKKRTTERERERETKKDKVKKGKAKKRLKRNKGKHRRMNNNNGLFWGKNKVLQLKAKTGEPKNNTNNEGLGPSEVALWATSPDP